MASGFKVGQCIKGKVSTYVLSKQLHKDIWTATYQALPIDRSPLPLTLNKGSNLGKMIIKSAPKYCLDNERDVLKHFHARPGIRQLMDETQDPPSLMLKHDDNLLTASSSKRLENPEIKFIAKRILEALGSCRFREVELGDCGDACFVNPKDHLKLGKNGHIIGAHMFRSPEALLNLRSGAPTDIWSFGTTLISLTWGLGWHIFKPDPKVDQTMRLILTMF
ncbi:hypothetical protein OIDMADRAFT_140304 [Oidiodendron maius Zn]|uniref:Protein kinase domain-containing protein n=1 Tax=Oidiodendron maius (strain Zn) TaxID=913774 RepID=A0A0C3HY22_OIDMZ|nr:hypothetical protein OIDMADRAFT_140304 [Oidiodendron maius Zn]